MKINVFERVLKIGAALALLFCLFGAANTDQDMSSDMVSLLPEISTWEQTESPQNYFPENLFEYINGAAEVYLSYDFRELLVAQFGVEGDSKNVAVEIYDMGSENNAFGIYSAERFPESRFLDIGVQGYIDEGILNFLVGRYYIKLFCFDCEEESEDTLVRFSDEISRRVKEKGGLPKPLLSFPKKGLVSHSEKYILRNFMGYSFLHDGYMASYEIEDQEFECFVIEGRDEADAQSMLEKYIETKPAETLQKKESVYMINDRYYQNIFITRAGRFLCGVLKIGEGAEAVGMEYLGELRSALM